MHIKVKSFQKLNKYPDYYFLSAWNHKKEIFKKKKKNLLEKVVSGLHMCLK